MNNREGFTCGFSLVSHTLKCHNQEIPILTCGPLNVFHWHTTMTSSENPVIIVVFQVQIDDALSELESNDFGGFVSRLRC